jgi:hypothetical protein
LNCEAASGFGREEIYIPGCLHVTIVWRTLSQIFAEEGRDEAEVGGKNRASLPLYQGDAYEYQESGNFVRRDGRSGGPAVSVGRITDEDRAALIMTLKKNIASEC